MCACRFKLCYNCLPDRGMVMLPLICLHLLSLSPPPPSIPTSSLYPHLLPLSPPPPSIPTSSLYPHLLPLSPPPPSIPTSSLYPHLLPLSPPPPSIPTSFPTLQPSEAYLNWSKLILDPGYLSSRCSHLSLTLPQLILKLKPTQTNVAMGTSPHPLPHQPSAYAA